MNQERRNFHTFDGLRFFAFLLVFLCHVTVGQNQLLVFFSNGGSLGVTFFFVLSGFLITYILLFEKRVYRQINLKKFMIRRILRIWPLFYLMLLFAFLSPYMLSLFHLSSLNDGYTPDWRFSFFFLENYKMMIADNFPNGAPLRVMWSLCVEEHFYLLWGLTFSFVKIKHIPFVIVLSIICGTVTRIVYDHYNISTSDLFSNLDFFAFGAIPAYLLVVHEDKLLTFIQNLSYSLKVGFVVVTVFFSIVMPNIHYWGQSILDPLFFSFLFSGIIFIIIPEQNRIKMGSNSIFCRMGVYTYGLYLTHTIVIISLKHLFVGFNANFDGFPTTIIFVSLSFFITLGVSMLLYHFFEKPFLNLKVYFK